MKLLKMLQKNNVLGEKCGLKIDTKQNPLLNKDRYTYINVNHNSPLHSGIIGYF